VTDSLRERSSHHVTPWPGWVQSTFPLMATTLSCLYWSRITTRKHEISQDPRSLADSLISFFVIITDVSILFFQSHTSVLVLLTSEYPLKHHSLSPKSSTLHFYPSLSRATPPTTFPTVIGRTKKEFYFRWPINLRFSERSLNFRGR